MQVVSIVILFNDYIKPASSTTLSYRALILMTNHFLCESRLILNIEATVVDYGDLDSSQM